MNQNRKDEDRDMPNRQSNMEKAEGSRDDTESFERGPGMSGRERGSGSAQERQRSGGITNRTLDEEQMEQDQLPERGRSQSER